MYVMRSSPRGKERQPRQSGLWLLLCFFLPAAVLLAVYAFFGMAPFGSKSILIMDLSEQYVDFFAGLKDIWNGRASVQFSWFKAFGQNYIGVIAYHLSSPLSLLTLLVPNEFLPTGLLFLNVLKIGLAGLAMGIFLKGFFNRCDLSTVIFSLLYGLTSYSIVYSMNLMWLDGVIWLPVVLLGIERLIRQGKSLLLLFSLAVVFVSTFYISYMIGIFACLFFLLRFFSVYPRPDWRLFVGRAVRFAGAAVVAAGLSAWLLLPTFQALYQGKIGDVGFDPQQLTNFPFFDQFSKLFIGSYSSIVYFGLPNLFCGVLAGVLFLLFFAARSIPLREKIGAGAITLFMLLSFYLVPLEKAWSAFQYPNWFPARYSFLFSFFVLFLAYRGFCCLRDFSPACLLGAGALSLAVIAAAALWANGASVGLTLILLTGAAVLIYVAALFLLRSRRKGWVALPILLVLVAAEMGLNAQQLVKGLDRQFGYKSNQAYAGFQAELQPLLAEAQERTDSFFRLEKTFERGKNDAIGLGYPGLTHYSSTYNREINHLTKSLGIAQQYFWSEYRGSTLLTDAVFGIRYLLAREQDLVFYPQVSANGQIGLYENPNALPLGFMVDGAVVSEPLPQPGDPFAGQNALLQRLTGDGGGYFSQLPYTAAVVGAREEQNQNQTHYKKEQSSASVTFTFVAPAGRLVYCYLPVSGRGSCRLSVNGDYRGDLFSDMLQCVLPVGIFDFDTELTITLRLQSDEITLNTPCIYALDIPALEDAANDLKQNGWDPKNYGAKSASAKVTATGKKQVLFTTIPYDEGWAVWVDGEPKEPLLLCGAFLGVMLEPGEHEVTVNYTAPGFDIGCWITLGTACLLILIGAACFIFKRKRLLRM